MLLLVRTAVNAKIAVFASPTLAKRTLYFRVLFITPHRLSKRDWQYGIAMGPTYSLKPSEFIKWSKEKNDEARRIATNLANIMNNAVCVALSPPGVSGDPDAILYAAKRFGLSECT
jgi:hypothetical protein